MKTKPILLFAALLTALLLTPASAAPRGKMAKPDFLKGDQIPEGANHDWLLGAIGARDVASERESEIE